MHISVSVHKVLSEPNHAQWFMWLLQSYNSKVEQLEEGPQQRTEAKIFTICPFTGKVSDLWFIGFLEQKLPPAMKSHFGFRESRLSDNGAVSLVRFCLCACTARALTWVAGRMCFDRGGKTWVSQQSSAWQTIAWAWSPARPEDRVGSWARAVCIPTPTPAGMYSPTIYSESGDA